MAKSGFSVSQRRKVEVISADGHVIKAHDCGTHFVVNDLGGGGNTITLPSIAQAGSGWHCRLTLAASQTSDTSVAATGTPSIVANIIDVEADGAAGITLAGGNTMVFEAVGAAGDSIDFQYLNGVIYATARSAT